MKTFSLFLLFLVVGFHLDAQTVLNGDHRIIGDMQVTNKLDILNTTPYTTHALLGRLDEGTFAIKAYNFQPVDCKMFAIEHRYYDQYINSAINFWRGGYHLGGWITFDVYDGRSMAKLSHYGLEVNGVVKAKEILVSNTNWADFVFNKNYTLRSIGEVNEYIKTNNHLPDMPTEAEVKENGINVGDMQTKLLQKIEELTLYLIQQQETINKLNDRIEQLENK
jgi:hypothetical protein